MEFCRRPPKALTVSGRQISAIVATSGRSADTAPASEQLPAAEEVLYPEGGLGGPDKWPELVAKVAQFLVSTNTLAPFFVLVAVTFTPLHRVLFAGLPTGGAGRLWSILFARSRMGHCMRILARSVLL